MFAPRSSLASSSASATEPSVGAPAPPSLSSAASLYWQPLGAPIVHPYVLASSCSFNATSGAPLVAYGAADEPGDTTTRVLEWTAARSWDLVATHTPQFAQPYENFNLKTAPGFLYLGLAIDPSDFPISRAQCDWFYQRSGGTVMRSAAALSATWPSRSHSAERSSAPPSTTTPT